MLVSIVTPSFRQGHFLEAAIRSVLEQDYPKIEYIVVDGGSQDGSAEIIQRYASRLAWWVSEPDQGHADALNKGFARANGELLAWLNSDDIYEPGAVREAVEYMQANPQVSMVYGDANFINDQGQVIGKFPARQTSYRRMRRGYVHIAQPSSFFRASAFRQVAPIDTSLYFSFDYDMWLKLAALGPVQYLPRLWSNFRLHGDCKTVLADDRCWPDMLEVNRRLGGSKFSVIHAKYLVRRVVAPYINWRRRRMFERGA